MCSGFFPSARSSTLTKSIPGVGDSELWTPPMLATNSFAPASSSAPSSSAQKIDCASTSWQSKVMLIDDSEAMSVVLSPVDRDVPDSSIDHGRKCPTTSSKVILRRFGSASGLPCQLPRLRDEAARRIPELAVLFEHAAGDVPSGDLRADPSGRRQSTQVGCQLHRRRPVESAEIEHHRRERIEEGQQRQWVRICPIDQTDPPLQQTASARLAHCEAGSRRVEPHVETVDDRSGLVELFAGLGRIDALFRWGKLRWRGRGGDIVGKLAEVAHRGHGRDRRYPVLRQIDAVTCRRSALAQSANRDVGRSVRTRSEVEGGDDQWIRRLRAEAAQGTADDAEQVSSVDCTCHLPTGIEFRAEAVVALALDGGRAGEFTGGCLGHALTLPITERTSSQIHVLRVRRSFPWR